MADQLLDVPFYNQLDEKNGLDPYWAERSCALLTLKMVMDYWLLKAGGSLVNLNQIFDETKADNGLDDKVNWRHAAIVRTARKHGFLAWRRGWMLSHPGREAFRAEGADSPTLMRIDLQHRREALPTLVEELENGFPVIVSVGKNFDEVEKPHMVVLTGLRRRDEGGAYQGFFYNDPFSPTKNDRKDRYVSIARFVEKWRSQAIFIEPKP